MNTISERIKEALISRGMKQSDLVEKTGIGKSSISTYISGDYEPKRKNIYKIAKALNVNESWLMGNDVPMEREQIISNITPEILEKDKLIEKTLFDATDTILASIPVNDDNGIDIRKVLSKEAGNYELKSNIYNELFHHLVYNQSDNKLDIYPNINIEDNNFSEQEKVIIEKYRWIDDKGKHTVETIIEMEYNRCNKKSN